MPHKAGYGKKGGMGGVRPMPRRGGGPMPPRRRRMGGRVGSGPVTRRPRKR